MPQICYLLRVSGAGDGAIELDGWEIYQGYDISMESQELGECTRILIWGGQYSTLTYNKGLLKYRKSRGIGVPEQKWDIVKTLKMLHLRVFWPPWLAPYQTISDV